jgi:formate hydrogenlyase transcriptional activator
MRVRPLRWNPVPRSACASAALIDPARRDGVALGRTEATVKVHVLHILQKLDAADRTEAVTIGLERGLQEREFERVGGQRPIRADVRIIAATNRDLHTAIADKTFRADLFYRLNVFPLEVPPLRERRGDIPLLMEYFTNRFSNRAGKRIGTIPKATLDALQAYDWPGNIRELQNLIERAVIISDGSELSVDLGWFSGGSHRLPSAVSAAASTGKPAGPVDERALDERALDERAVIEAALQETRGRVAGPFGAAMKLGMPPSTLESKIKSLNIDKRRFKPIPPSRSPEAPPRSFREAS